jgi:hypothetical protein
MSEILVPISIGELLDKITILRIKAERISAAAKLHNINTELQALLDRWHAAPVQHAEVQSQMDALHAVNLRLWDIEDRIRLKEGAADFGAEFIELARAVYFENDVRAKLKRDINMILGSVLVEEKSYASYARGEDRPQV